MFNQSLYKIFHEFSFLNPFFYFSKIIFILKLSFAFLFKYFFLILFHYSLLWAYYSFSFVNCPTFRNMYLWAFYLGQLEFLSFSFSTLKMRPHCSAPGSSLSCVTCLVFLSFLYQSLSFQGFC